METKKTYITPQVELVKLDNEISLALESSPPEGPNETNNTMTAPEYFGNEPFNTVLG
jgi:hypothetical protein